MPGAGCGKPDFFIQKKPLFEVHLDTGMLYNTDGGTPMVRPPLHAKPEAQSSLLPKGQHFTGVFFCALGVTPRAPAPLQTPCAVYSSQSKQRSQNIVSAGTQRRNPAPLAMFEQAPMPDVDV